MDEEKKELDNSNNLLKYIIIQKENKSMLKRIIMYSIITCTILLYFYLITYLMMQLSNKSCSIILAKYDDMAKSSFSNKDQYTDPNVDNYDIHYLVEQMIYKEFNSIDKKKYLNLPQVFKDKVIVDYLIKNI
jgi:hypothetical protein